MLLQNKRLLYQTPVYFFGGSAIDVSNSFQKNYRGRFIAEGWDKKASMPLGTEPPYSYVLAQNGGGLASYTGIRGVGNVNANAVNGINISGNLEGVGSLTSSMNLITSMISNLAGSGLLSASLVGTVQLASDIIGSGDLVGGLKLFAGMVAAINGSSELTSDLKGTSYMQANIFVNQSQATVNELVNGVWNAVATEYNNLGTMGEAVQSGGGGGGATPAQIWSYASRTLTESAGLTPEQDAKLMSLGPTGGGFSINYDNINSVTKRAIEDARKKIEEKIEAIPQADMEPITTEIKLASEAIIETIESEADRVNVHTTEAKKDLKVEVEKTKEVVKQKAEKLDSKISKLADRQDQIDKSIDLEAEEIERKLDEIYEAEAKDIERRMDEIYEAEADDIEAKLNLQ